MSECPSCGHELAEGKQSCPACGDTGLLDLPVEDPILGEYRLVHSIGKGGFGEVYLAEQTTMGRLAAVKLLHPELTRSPKMLARFKREAGALSSINHPHIVTVYSFGVREDGTHYLAMEYVEGEPLRRVLRQDGPLPLDRALDLAEQIADGLAAAHDNNVLHRDLKPENVIVTRMGDRPDFVKVLDFGIAQLLCPGLDEDEAPTALTSRGIVGTPWYVSPEQARGQPLDGRSDVYALGVILYELLTGRYPYESLASLGRGSFDPMAVLLAHVNDPTLPPTSPPARAPVPPEVEGLVLAALEKDPERRVASMRAFRDGVRKCRSGAGETGGPDDAPATAEVLELALPGRGRRRAAAAGGVALGLAALAAVVVIWTGGGTSASRDPAPASAGADTPTPSWAVEPPERSERLMEFQGGAVGSPEDPALLARARQQVAAEAYAAVAVGLERARPDRTEEGAAAGPRPSADLWARLVEDAGGADRLALREHTGVLPEAGLGAVVRVSLAGEAWRALVERYAATARARPAGVVAGRPLPTWADSGALVTAVEPRSRAGKAGLRVGDVALRVGEQAAAGPEELAGLLRSGGRRPVVVEILRPGAPGPLELTLPAPARPRRRARSYDDDIYR